MPLPTDLELPTPQNKEWELIPEDVYQCEITDIEYKVEKNNFKKKDTDPDEVQKMNFEFTIIEDGKWYGRKLWKKMAVTKPLPPRGNNNKSWIFRIASALAGRELTYDEGLSYTTSDINGFIHRQLRLTVIQEVSKTDGKTYNNIDGFLAVKQPLSAFDPKKVSDESAVVEDEPEQPLAPETAPVTPELTPAKAAMMRGMEKHQNPQVSEEDIKVSDIPF